MLQVAVLHLGPLALARVTAEEGTETTLLPEKVTGLLDGTTTPTPTTSTRLASEQEEAVFKRFTASYGKNYTDPQTSVDHERGFVQNYRYIQEFNANGSKCSLKLSEVADLDLAEFERTHFGLEPEDTEADERRRLNFGDPARRHIPSRSLKDLPDAVDWEKAGGVTRVKDQGSCGSCYSFATIAALEGAWFVQTGQLIDMSNQQVVDCTYQQGPDPQNLGCGGGYMSTSFKHMKEGVCNWNSYPYDMPGAVGDCTRKDACTVAVLAGYVVDYKWVRRQNMEALMEAVVQQPVAVAIAAGTSAFQLYGSGIISAEACGKSVNHAVLLVGYGTDSSDDYWRLKNTWGTSWGEDGYFRIERGASGSGGCGILSQPAYVTISDSAQINDDAQDGGTSTTVSGGSDGDSDGDSGSDSGRRRRRRSGGSDGDDSDDPVHGIIWDIVGIMLIFLIGLVMLWAFVACLRWCMRGSKRSGYRGAGSSADPYHAGSDYWDAPYGADPAAQMPYPSYGYPSQNMPQQLVPYSY